jgi:hypothetical protein
MSLSFSRILALWTRLRSQIGFVFENACLYCSLESGEALFEIKTCLSSFKEKGKMWAKKHPFMIPVSLRLLWLL